MAAPLNATWETGHRGALGLELAVSLTGHCDITLSWRGASERYETVGLLSVRGDTGWPPGFTYSLGESSAREQGFLPRARIDLPQSRQGIDIDHEPQWQRTFSTSADFDEEGRIFVALASLDPSVPFQENITSRGIQAPLPDGVSASLHLACDQPGTAHVVGLTDTVSMFDDWSLRGDGVSLGAADQGGLRLALVASMGLSFQSSGNTTFIASFPTDPEKAAAVELHGPDQEWSWFSPPTTWVGIGDVSAFATGPGGDYQMQWTEIGAGPFLIFRGVFYDFGGGAPRLTRSG